MSVFRGVTATTHIYIYISHMTYTKVYRNMVMLMENNQLKTWGTIWVLNPFDCLQIFLYRWQSTCTLHNSHKSATNTNICFSNRRAYIYIYTFFTQTYFTYIILYLEVFHTHLYVYIYIYNIFKYICSPYIHILDLIPHPPKRKWPSLKIPPRKRQWSWIVPMV